GSPSWVSRVSWVSLSICSLIPVHFLPPSGETLISFAWVFWVSIRGSRLVAFSAARAAEASKQVCLSFVGSTVGRMLRFRFSGRRRALAGLTLTSNVQKQAQGSVMLRDTRREWSCSVLEFVGGPLGGDGSSTVASSNGSILLSSVSNRSMRVTFPNLKAFGLNSPCSRNRPASLGILTRLGRFRDL